MAILIKAHYYHFRYAVTTRSDAVARVFPLKYARARLFDTFTRRTHTRHIHARAFKRQKSYTSYIHILHPCSQYYVCGTERVDFYP